MPKKNRKNKKKSTVVLNTEINIVDEGQSSLDVSDVVRKQKEDDSAKPENPVIEIRDEAPDNEVRNAEANNFSVSEVTSLRKFDSLAVSGRQESINSNFSFFSDNNLTEKDNLEDFEDERWNLAKEAVTHQEIVTTQTRFYAQSADITDGPELKIEEMLDSEMEEGVQIVESVSPEMSSEEDNNFLGNLRTEILEESKSDPDEATEDEQRTTRRSKSKLSWDNLVFKREIKIGFQAEREVGITDSSLRERLELMFENKISLNEETLRAYFPAGEYFFDQEECFGFVSPVKSLTLHVPRGDPFQDRDKVCQFSFPRQYSDRHDFSDSKLTVSLITSDSTMRPLEPPTYSSGFQRS